MSESPRRQRRETAEAPVGIGGLSPHPARGRITALRILGRGFEIAVDESRAERLGGTAGDRLTIEGELALALDEPTHKLVQMKEPHPNVMCPSVLVVLRAGDVGRR